MDRSGRRAHEAHAFRSRRTVYPTLSDRRARPAFNRLAAHGVTSLDASDVADGLHRKREGHQARCDTRQRSGGGLDDLRLGEDLA